MNRYLCSVEYYCFGDPKFFEVNATDEEDAWFVAKQHIERNYNIFGANYIEKSIRVIQKLKKGE